jgi:DNA-binding PadR family transcriptional regulator
MENNGNIKSDYEYSRDTYYEILEKGKESMELMIEVARESEHPRAFEVLSGMMKNMADINDKLMDLNKKNRDINEEPKQAQVGTTTNNNLFIGSTTDLQRFLQAEDNNNVIDMTPRLDDK